MLPSPRFVSSSEQKGWFSAYRRICAVFCLVVVATAGCAQERGSSPIEETGSEAVSPEKRRLAKLRLGGAPPNDLDRVLVRQWDGQGLTLEEGSDQLIALAWADFFRNDFHQAMEHFNQAWMLDPNNGDAYHGFALVLVERDKDLDGAEEMFREALDAPRLSSSAHADYARFLLLHRRQPDQAIPLLEIALEREPDNLDALGNMAMAHYDTEQYARFCVFAEKAMAHPDIDDVYVWRKVLGETMAERQCK